MQSNKQVTLYCRLAQYDEKRIVDQISKTVEICHQKGLDYHLLYIDNGYSGLTPDRPGYQKMIDALMAGEISDIVIYSLCRLFRSYKVSIVFHAVCEAKGVKLHTMVPFHKDNSLLMPILPRGRACDGKRGGGVDYDGNRYEIKTLSDQNNGTILSSIPRG